MAASNPTKDTCPKLPSIRAPEQPPEDEHPQFHFSNYKKTNCYTDGLAGPLCGCSLTHGPTYIPITKETKSHSRESGGKRRLEGISRTAQVPQLPGNYSHLLNGYRPKRYVPDPIPIPQMPVSDRYPYRYTSAEPAYDRLKWKELKRCINVIRKNEGLREPIDLRFVVQKAGYETTSMSSALKVFTTSDAQAFSIPAQVPGSLTTPLYVPFAPTSDFDRYLLNELIPDWHSNPKYKRRIMYWVKSDDPTN